MSLRLAGLPSPTTDLSEEQHQHGPNNDCCHRWSRHSQEHSLRGGHRHQAIDITGRLLGHHEFPATDRGYLALLTWVRSHGTVQAIGVESTGSFGATLTRALIKANVQVIEVNRPNRQARHADGKSDRLDAEQIARSVLGQTATAIPKAKTAMVEVIRTLRVTRASAVRSAPRRSMRCSGS